MNVVDCFNSITGTSIRNGIFLFFIELKLFVKLATKLGKKKKESRIRFIDPKHYGTGLAVPTCRPNLDVDSGGIEMHQADFLNLQRHASMIPSLTDNSITRFPRSRRTSDIRFGPPLADDLTHKTDSVGRPWKKKRRLWRIPTITIPSLSLSSKAKSTC